MNQNQTYIYIYSYTYIYIYIYIYTCVCVSFFLIANKAIFLKSSGKVYLLIHSWFKISIKSLFKHNQWNINGTFFFNIPMDTSKQDDLAIKGKLL